MKSYLSVSRHMNIFRIRTPSVCEVFREFTVLPEFRSFYGIFGSLMHRLKAHDIPRRMTPSGRRSDIGNNVKSAEMEPNPLRDEGQTALFRAKSFVRAQGTYLGISTKFP